MTAVITCGTRLGVPREAGIKTWEEGMDTFECIRTRRTTRTFVPQEIPAHTIHRILEAGRLTPSARNRYPWHFIAIRDQAL
jgi:nitroreductase